MRHSLNYLIYSLIFVFVTACGGGGGTTLTSITSFEASATTIAEGSNVILTAVFTNGTASINNGVGAVASNVAKSVEPPIGITTYTLRVTNSLGASITSSVTVTVLPAYNIFPPGFFEDGYSHNINFIGEDSKGDDHTATLLEESGDETRFNGDEVKTIDETLQIKKGVDTISAGLRSQQYWTTDENNRKYLGYEIPDDEFSNATATSESIMPITTYIGDSGTMGSYKRSDDSTFTITWKLVDDTSGPNKAKYITTTVSRDSDIDATLLYTATVTSFINQAGTISKQTIVIIYHEEPDRTLTLTSTEP